MILCIQDIDTVYQVQDNNDYGFCTYLWLSSSVVYILQHYATSIIYTRARNCTSAAARHCLAPRVRNSICMRAAMNNSTNKELHQRSGALQFNTTSKEFHSNAGLDGQLYGQGLSPLAQDAWRIMKTCKPLLLALLLSSSVDFVKGINYYKSGQSIATVFPSHAVSNAGLVEISPSPVAPVCQVGDQLELRCSSTGIIH